jgi:hypothetical protein
MHPYPPIQDTDPFSKPFQWPQAGAANLDRIKQALWDAFGGTDQPVPAQQGPSVAERTTFGGQPLPIDLDEAGEQTLVAGHAAAYSQAPENVRPVAEAIQAARHVELAHIGECDPDVRSVLWFPLIDDSGLSDGFQSGNLYADLTHKRSYGAMKLAIAADRGACVAPVAGVATSWRYDTDVSGARASFAGRLAPLGSEPSPQPATVRALTAAVTAEEAATYSATLLAADAVRPAASATGSVRPYARSPIRFSGPFRAGRYTIELVLQAATNPARTTVLTSRSFVIGP